VVRQSRLQRDGLFGALVAVFLIAIVRGYPHAQTATGRVVLVVFVAAVTAALVLAWARLIRHPCRVPFFSVREVRRQCLAAGWSFAGRR
jgi:hypothetical protein